MSPEWVRALRRRVVARTELCAYACDLGDLPSGLLAHPGINIRLATPADLPTLAAALGPVRTQFHDFGRGELGAILRDHLNRGHVCAMAEVAGRTAGLCWARSENASLDEFGIHVPLQAGQAYLYGAYTAPAYRGYQVMSHLVLAMLLLLRSQGTQATYAWVRATNRPAISVLTRTGWRRVGRVVRFVWKPAYPAGLLGIVLSDPSDPLAAPLFERLIVRRTLVVLRPGSSP